MKFDDMSVFGNINYVDLKYSNEKITGVTLKELKK